MNEKTPHQNRRSFPQISKSEVTHALPFRWPKTRHNASTVSPLQKSSAQNILAANPYVDKMLAQSKTALTTNFAKCTFDIAIYGKPSFPSSLQSIESSTLSLGSKDMEKKNMKPSPKLPSTDCSTRRHLPEYLLHQRAICG